MNSEEGIFPHQCKAAGCEIVVEFDDEPFCFTHSPDSGSSDPSFSARREAADLRPFPSGESFRFPPTRPKYPELTLPDPPPEGDDPPIEFWPKR